MSSLPLSRTMLSNHSSYDSSFDDGDEDDYFQNYVNQLKAENDAAIASDNFWFKSYQARELALDEAANAEMADDEAAEASKAALMNPYDAELQQTAFELQSAAHIAHERRIIAAVASVEATQDYQEKLDEEVRIKNKGKNERKTKIPKCGSTRFLSSKA